MFVEASFMKFSLFVVVHKWFENSRISILDGKIKNDKSYSFCALKSFGRVQKLIEIFACFFPH